MVVKNNAKLNGVGWNEWTNQYFQKERIGERKNNDRFKVMYRMLQVCLCDDEVGILRETKNEIYWKNCWSRVDVDH